MSTVQKSPIQKPSLTLKRHYAAPIERVYRAWTDPEALKRWFGPSDEGRILVSETNPTVGGRYRIVMEMPSGEQHRVGGIYRELVPNEKLVFTWAWESTPERESLVTVRTQALRRRHRHDAYSRAVLR